MARPLRITFDGALYHVMNRGLNRAPVFHTRIDYETFLHTLGQACSCYNVKLYAFCLMPNHYHLLIQTQESNLSRFMRHVDGIYTQRFNRCHKRDGPLFRGRYKSILVQADTYLIHVARYIHLNPLKAKLTEQADHYEWSSHKFYIKGKGLPVGLDTRLVLSMFSADHRQALRSYKKFMLDTTISDLDQFYASKKLKSILGEDGFIEQIKEEHIYSDNKPDNEVTEKRMLRGECVVLRVKREVCRSLNVKERSLYAGGRGKENTPRQMAIALSKDLSGLTLSEIAKLYGIKSYKTLGSHCYRFNNLMASDNILARAYSAIKAKYSQEET